MEDFFNNNFVRAFQAGQQVRQARETHQQAMDDAKLRQDILKHSLSAEKINQQIAEREFAQKSALMRPPEMTQTPGDLGTTTPEPPNVQPGQVPMVPSPMGTQLTPHPLPPEAVPLPGVESSSGGTLLPPGVETRNQGDVMAQQLAQMIKQKQIENAFKDTVVPQGGTLVTGNKPVFNSPAKPMAVRPGGTLVDPTTGQPTFTNPAAAQTPKTPFEAWQAQHPGEPAENFQKTVERIKSAIGGNSKDIARADKSYQFNVGQLNTISKPIDDAIQRLGRLEDTLTQNTPQADALVAPELLTVMAGGAGSGLRMNEAEIARIVGGRSNWQSLQASINKWKLDPAAARSITPEQQQQIHALVSTVHSKLLAKKDSIDGANNALIDAQSPEDHRRIVGNLRTKLFQIDAGQVASPLGHPAVGSMLNGKKITAVQEIP